ncbi:MAG: IS110 family transposase [Hyalangium sp.]|uniref:IS110 family transposase n=1 Tax=Hyalangium sp. TaxID=2028555 RepID=UPI0038997E40
MEKVRKQKGKSQRRPLPSLNGDAAGIDIGATFHVVAVPPGRAEESVRSFGSFTGDLHALGDWLQELGITTVAMESTGVYWIPVFELLEARGLEVLLVNARDVKNVPGRKTDVNDAQWLQQLHEHGLLRGSFRPRDQVVRLRAYLRHRERLIEYAASHIQHMQKALMQMNVQLHHVVTDITGVTGMKIIRAIIKGARDPKLLAQHRDSRCKASTETIEKALTGNYRPEHVFALRQALELYEFHQAKVAECDVEVEAVLKELNESRATPEKPMPAVRHARGRNEPDFDVRSAMYTLLGADLTQIHGFGAYTVLRLIAECGDDMRKWPTAKHFTSWLSLAPGNKISGGRLLSSKTRRSSNRAASLLRIAAVNIGRTQTALGAFYRRLAARTGKAKAVTATARKLAVLFYNALRHGLAYVDPGASYYEDRYRQRVVHNLERRAKQMGYALVAAEQTPSGVS